jgi:choline dehydrogenase-like flavoprotein
MSIVDADFIVIGSGPAGVSAAIPLVAAGRKVLMVDGAGPSDEPETPQPLWRRALGDELQALRADDHRSPKLRTPLADATIDPFRGTAAIAATDFFTIGALARGGLSQIWGTHVSELDARDLADWPIGLEDLGPSYHAISTRIGLSGSVDDDMAEFYGQSAKILAAPPLGATAAMVFSGYQRAPQHDFKLGVARNALLTTDRGERRSCDLSLGCLWGCTRGALYDARHDVALLQRDQNFHLLDGARVIRLASAPGGWRVSIADREQPLLAPRVVIAAGPLASLCLLAPLLDDAPLRLLNSPVLALPLIVLARIGATPPQSGHTLAQLGFTYAYGARARDYITGAIYEIATLPPSSFVARLPFSRRAGTEIFRALASAILVATIYFPGDCSANRVQIDRSGDDIRIAIRGGTSEGFAVLANGVRRFVAARLHRCGARALPGATVAMAGTDAHLGGLFPMGAKGAHGTSILGELNGAPGLHLVDGSVLPLLPSKPTTLTIMANADRIGRQLASLG